MMIRASISKRISRNVIMVENTTNFIHTIIITNVTMDSNNIDTASGITIGDGSDKD